MVEDARSWPSQRIADDVRAKIESGELQPGDKLESDRSLSAELGVARNTVQAAYRLLGQAGLVDIVHGSGVYVRQPRSLIRLGGERYSKALREQTGKSPFHAELEKQGRRGHSVCTSVRRVQPPADVAERLGVSTQTKSVIARENWYYVEDQPIQACWTYIPIPVAQGTVLARNSDLGPGDIYARFEDAGHPIASYREEASARMPTPDEIKLLQIPPGVPVIDLLHTSIDDKGDAFEVTRFVMRADSTGLDYVIKNDS